VNHHELLAFLDANSITYTEITHPPVYTCEQADIYTRNAAGIGTKNLFLRDERLDTYYYLMTLREKRIDFKQLCKTLVAHKLTFASIEQVNTCMGVEPGAISILGLINDTQREIKVIIDKCLWEYDVFQCHPLINNATLIISRKDIEKFLSLTGREINLIEIPCNSLK